MHALDLRDNALQWESERQNRLLKTAAEQKKKQTRLSAVETPPAATGGAGDVTMSAHLGEWLDKVVRIPELRSALVPLEEEEDGWSKPFSLAKADMEPWTSYYKGYRQSRLFLHSPSSITSDGPSAEAQIDYPVRALLELKRAAPRLISEPPVQINGPVEYFDPETELRDSRDAAHFRSVLRNAVTTHDRQLQNAEDKGRQMGDALYDALMGEGHANLIRAWEKNHRRKPSVEELHLMLTAGRIRAMPEKKSPAAVAPPKETVREAVAAPSAPRPAPERRAVPVMKAPPPAMAEADDDDDSVVMLSGPAKPDAARPSRKLYWSIFHASVACAAVAGYVFFF